MSGAIKLTLAKRTPPLKAQTMEASAVEMEKRIIMIRWLSIALAALTVPFLHLKPAQAFPLVGLIAVGAVYNTVLQFVLLPRKPTWLTRGYISAIGDVLFVTVVMRARPRLSGSLPRATFGARCGGERGSAA